jgi:hypothetical protein
MGKLKPYGEVTDDWHHGKQIAKVWLRMNGEQAMKFVEDAKALAAWWGRAVASRVERAEREAAADVGEERREADLLDTMKSLLGEAKKYIVYVDGEEQKELITAGSHNAAEKKAQKKYPGKQVRVSYTEV